MQTHTAKPQQYPSSCDFCNTGKTVTVYNLPPQAFFRARKDVVATVCDQHFQRAMQQRYGVTVEFKDAVRSDLNTAIARATFGIVIALFVLALGASMHRVNGEYHLGTEAMSVVGDSTLDRSSR